MILLKEKCLNGLSQKGKNRPEPRQLKKNKVSLQTQNIFLSIFMNLHRLNICPLYEG